MPEQEAEDMPAPEPYTSTVNSRVGLMGNPSDGMGGAAVAVSIQNFFATVTIEPCDKVKIVPHPRHDAMDFPSLEDLHMIAARDGYYGGRRLLMATCSRFFQSAHSKGFVLDERGFKLSYDTTIPRQLGLSGSSALVCATFNCLLHWFGLDDEWPVPQRPQFVLDVEASELGITGGLMDRVAQVYGGVVYMNLRPSAAPTAAGSGGEFEYLPAEALPKLWLMYPAQGLPHEGEGTAGGGGCDAAGGESGAVHAPVRQRWLEGDSEVVEGMRSLAELADALREKLLESGGVSKDDLARLIDANVATRRRLYGDAALCATTLSMLELARSVGAAAKFCGSGGAVVVCIPGGETQEAELLGKCAEGQLVLQPLHIAPRLFDSIDG
eukprot:jgi/Ulvmu1/8479/UM044_0012.1